MENNMSIEIQLNDRVIEVKPEITIEQFKEIYDSRN